MSTVVCVGRAEDNLRELVLGFHHMVSGIGTELVSLGDKNLYSLSHLLKPTSPLFLRHGFMWLRLGTNFTHGRE